MNERAEIKPSIVVRCENKLNPQWKNDQRKKWSKDWMNNEIWCWNGIDGYEWNAAGATDLRENNEAGKKELMKPSNETNWKQTNYAESIQAANSINQFHK